MTLKKAVAAATFGLAIAALGAGAANAAVTAGGVLHTGVDPDTGAWDGEGQRPPGLEGHSVPLPPTQPGVTLPYDPNNVDPQGSIPFPNN